MTTSFERAVARSARKPASDHACTCSIKRALSAASCEANALGSVYPIKGAVNVSSSVNWLVSQDTTSRPLGGSSTKCTSKDRPGPFSQRHQHLAGTKRKSPVFSVSSKNEALCG